VKVQKAAKKMKNKSLNKFYLGGIIFKPDERTNFAIEEVAEFLLRWYRRVGLPFRNKKDLQRLRKYVKNNNAGPRSFDTECEQGV